MNRSAILRFASLLSLLLITIHLSQDVLLLPLGEVEYPIPVVVFTVWLYGSLFLSERIAGQIIMLLGGFFGAAMIVVHSKGGVVGKDGGLFFVWTLFALSATAWLTMILAAQGLWTRFRARRGRQPREIAKVHDDA